MDIPHCPNPRCCHFSHPPEHTWYIRYGFHRTKAFGSIQRFKCKHCGSTFSTRTFEIDYCTKKRVEYTPLIEQLVTGSGLLDISRQMNLRPECIENRFERLSRVALAIHADLLEALPMQEDFVADGFETFSYSQYYPNHANILVGKRSEFIYAMGFANLRRKGRMTAAQKKKRAALEKRGKAHPKALEQSMRNLVADSTQRLIMKGISMKMLYTDEHAAYPRAFRTIEGFSQLFTHVRISSKNRVQRARQLCAVDYVDHQFRKDMSDHARETVQFAKCPSAQMARLVVYRFYHNCCIPRREMERRKGNMETHAERAGVSRKTLDEIIRRYWGKRVFLQKTSLCREERNTWLCAWRNPGRSFGRYIPHYIAA